jgi:histone H4
MKAFMKGTKTVKGVPVAREEAEADFEVTPIPEIVAQVQDRAADEYEKLQAMETQRLAPKQQKKKQSRSVSPMKPALIEFKQPATPIKVTTAAPVEAPAAAESKKKKQPKKKAAKPRNLTEQLDAVDMDTTPDDKKVAEVVVQEEKKRMDTSEDKKKKEEVPIPEAASAAPAPAPAPVPEIIFKAPVVEKEEDSGFLPSAQQEEKKEKKTKQPKTVSAASKGTLGAKRHKGKRLRDNIQGITKPAIRRLARRGGVKRISGLMYEETRGILKIFIEEVLRDTVHFTEHAKRKTVSAMDVVYALKRQGKTIYGFGG